jgi:DNA-binding XRE family transcriptional regulator
MHSSRNAYWVKFNVVYGYASPDAWRMQKRPIKRGRPAGTTTFEKGLAVALGLAVRAQRKSQHLGQEALANAAGIERSHVGKIEGGKHVATLPLIFRLARALDCNAAVLIADTEQRLKALPAPVATGTRSAGKKKPR